MRHHVESIALRRCLIAAQSYVTLPGFEPPTAGIVLSHTTFNRLADNLDALARYYETDAKGAGDGIDTREAPVGEVVAMPVRLFKNAGAFFEPDTVTLMSEAFEAACNVLPDARQPEAVREVIARRIIAAVAFGERDPVQLRAAALAGRRPRGFAGSLNVRRHGGARPTARSSRLTST